MSTIHVDHLLSDFLDGDLTRPLLEKAKSHLAFCNACRQRRTELEKNREALSHLAPVAPPPGLDEKIIAKLHEAPAPVEQPPKMPRRPLSRDFYVAIGGLALFTLLIFVFLNRTPETQPVPVPIKKEAPKPLVPPPAPAPVVQAPPVAAPVVPEGPLDLRGSTSGIDQPQEMVIKNDAQWKNVWKNHVKNIIPAPPIPVVDFDKNEVIAVFGGAKASGGYAVEITTLEETSWNGEPAEIVHYKASQPAPGTMPTMAMTQPFHMKTVEKLPPQVFFWKNR